MKQSLATYASARETLLGQIVETLSADDRFRAAWLTGSYGRNEADEVSDLDLAVVVADSHAETLCARPWQSAARTTEERLALFAQFGEPAIIHETNFNAPEGGTFTCVIYESAVVVDWSLRPRLTATRPFESRLLFDKIGIPLDPTPAPEPLEQRVARASEKTAFFWMMAAITVKYIIRRDDVRVNELLELLRYCLAEVERLLVGQAYRYPRGARGNLAPTVEAQLEAVRQLCDRMSGLMAEVERGGDIVPTAPGRILNRLLNFV
ncbi:MAG TPA: nucleotidyltransferase domain-containing protein [Anaerolineales bacterium]|nr:nucleotidyltransferase domain-containing protein [Anaerolineales bacterium]